MPLNEGAGVRDQLAARGTRRFAEIEARDRSPLYASIASSVAADPFALEFLGALPDEKQQPNLLLAAVRYVCGAAEDWPQFRAMLRDNAPAVAAVMRARRTQTNEPARCATLLPALARLSQPLALLEVGVSAGLCLLPDRYGYDYGRYASRRHRPTHRYSPARRTRRRQYRRHCRELCGGWASISRRSTSLTMRRRNGSRRWSGLNRNIGSSACVPRSWWPGAIRHLSCAAIC